jgi:putative hydrolase of the HAD superfamily
MNLIKVIAFDADDTLWENETFFRKAEEEFCNLLKEYISGEQLIKKLLKVEYKNLTSYGYGIKGFMLSMIETAIDVSNGKVSNEIIQSIMEIGNKMLLNSVEILEGVDSVLENLHPKYKLVVLTKGDLLDQERKLNKSNLQKYFHHVEIVSEKKETDYQRILNNLEIEAHEFLMVGNSLKSDIIPVLNVGGHAFHIPFHTTWELEKVDEDISHPKFKELKTISEVLNHVL